jgi:hypothetical protein
MTPNPAVYGGQGQAVGNIAQYEADDILLAKNIMRNLVMAYDDAVVLYKGVGADMESMGRVEETTTTENYHYQTGSYFASALVGSIVSSAAGTITFQVDAVGASGTYASPGNVGDVALLGDQQYQAKISAKTGGATDAVHTITLVRGTGVTDYALNDTAVINTGDFVTFPFSGQVAGEDFPDGIVIRDVRFRTPLHYMMTSTSEILADLANQEMNVQLANEGGTQYIVNRQDVALMVRSQVKRAFALLFADGSSYTATVDGASKAFTTTQGLYPTAKEFGTKIPVTPGLLDIDDVYTIANTSGVAQVSGELIGYLGPNRKQEWDTVIGTFFNNGAVIYDGGAFATKVDPATGVASKLNPTEATEHAVNLGYNTIALQGFKLSVKIPIEFYHNVIASGIPANGYYWNTGLFMPSTGGTTTFGGKQIQGSSFVIKQRMGLVDQIGGPRVRLRVVNQGPANFGSERFKKTLIEEFGVQTLNPQKFILMTP